MADSKTYNLEAVYLSKEINLAKASEKLDQNLIGKRREFLTYLLGSDEYLFVFSFGAVVFVNIAVETQSAIRRSLGKFLTNSVRRPYQESYILENGSKTLEVGDSTARMPTIGSNEIEIVVRILAQSVALEYTEDLTDEILTNVEAMNTELEKEGRFLKSTSSILQLSARNNGIIQFVVSKLSLLDKPDITWEQKNLEILFSRLSDLFELRSRFRNIEYKISFARENSELALTVLQGRRESFLEIIIILLIALDIVLYFFGG